MSKVSQHKCDIIVPLYNKIEFTKEFVHSLQANTDVPVRVIFIDNNSTDDTRNFLLSLRPIRHCHFKIILNDENEGFIRAVNEGMKISEAPFICIANNDLIFTKRWLEEILDIFKKFPDIGLLNPNSNNLGLKPEEGTSLNDFAEQLDGKYRGTMTEHPACVGFCMVLKRTVVDKIGGLSEEFIPMFFEDTDYSRRVVQAGFKIGVAKASYVWHHEHGSLSQLGPEQEKIYAQSEATFIKKWGKPLRVAWVLSEEAQLQDALEDGIHLARYGNNVWFYVKGLKKSDQEIFDSFGFNEFAGMHFIKIRTLLDLIWKVAIKKKRFDYVIVEDGLPKTTLSMMGQTIVSREKVTNQFKRT